MANSAKSGNSVFLQRVTCVIIGGLCLVVAAKAHRGTTPEDAAIAEQRVAVEKVRMRVFATETLPMLTMTENSDPCTNSQANAMSVAAATPRETPTKSSL